MDIQQVVSIWSTLTPEQQNALSNTFAQLNTENRNMDRVQNFTEKVLEKSNKKITKIQKFIESESMNCLIYAPTQVGKTAATRQFIECCLERNVPVIVSTDNKTDQQEQMYERIKNDLIGTEVEMMRVSDKRFVSNFENNIKNNKNRMVIFCLDNSSQIKKLTMCIGGTLMTSRKNFEFIKKIAIIHDEADTVTKDKNVETVSNDQPLSHKLWIELFGYFKQYMSWIDIKRVFVTATPENCCMLYNVECTDVIKLEISSTYVGYKNIIYNNFEDDWYVRDILHAEVDRIKREKSGEIILYCLERKIEDGQDIVFNGLRENFRCIINTYNGNGVKCSMRTIAQSNKLEKMLKSEKYKYERDGKVFEIGKISIRKFYSLCKRVGETCVITIGKDLIARGISYVSEDRDNPLTATTMIYKPGTTMHAVGICQAIGRITGTARPELTRRLYAPEDVITTYKLYNENQEMYVEKISRSNGEVTTKTLIEEMRFMSLKRSIDRQKLKLKMNTIEEHREDVNDDESRMKHLINLWWGRNTIIGRILKYVYDNTNGVSENDLKEFLRNQTESERTWYTDLHCHSKYYICVFERNSSRITNLKSEARRYINTL